MQGGEADPRHFDPVSRGDAEDTEFLTTDYTDGTD
jgi:hypothetical protein